MKLGLKQVAFVIAFAVLPLSYGFTQEPVASSATNASSQVATTTSLAKGLGLFVFPGEGQTQETQDADEMSSYKWAMEQTGYDPINPPELQVKEADTSLDGSAVVGGAKGAAAGAAIGAIAGDAGKGAAIGAVAGGLAGRRARKYGDHVEQQQNEQQVAAQEAKMLDDFKKAFSASMEAKGYTVK